MSDDEIEARLRELGLPSPPPAARARVLSACGREMARRYGRRGAKPLALKLAVALVALVLADAAVTASSNAVVLATATPKASAASASQSPTIAQALRARSRMVALLLREPSGM